MILDYLPCFYKQNELEIAGFYQGYSKRKIKQTETEKIDRNFNLLVPRKLIDHS